MTADATADELPAIDGARLFLPAGWVLSDISVARLRRQLARAPEDVAAIVTTSGPPPAGSSYRVHAERLALLSFSNMTESQSGATRAAALLRETATAAASDDFVDIDGGTVLVDEGTHAHDPLHPLGAPASATVLGRPPFPWRPVVVLLACDALTSRGDWTRDLVNDLVGLDIEARLAAPDEVPGPHLTVPCTPTEASIRVLRPDVVVCLDATAATSVDAWCEGIRQTVVIDAVQHSVPGIDLIGWQVDVAKGRLRARIGEDVAAARIADLVRRLCAGPLPTSPSPPVSVQITR